MEDFNANIYKVVNQYSTEVNNNIEQLIVKEIQNYYDVNYAISYRERYIINAKKIIEAIIKGTAQKVNFIDWSPHCPNCNNDRLYTEDNTNMKYCSECGQKLDWNIND